MKINRINIDTDDVNENDARMEPCGTPGEAVFSKYVFEIVAFLKILKI
jgi:hypothetical protein